MQLAFKNYGDTGLPVIILHGLFGSFDNWHSISERLAEKFQVFALDLRNHGKSPHAEEMSYPSMAEDVHEFILLQGLGAAHVIGHSLGGKIAMQLACAHPGDVRSLISIDIGPGAYEPRHEDIIRGLLGLNLSLFTTRQQIEQALAPAEPDLATRRFLLKNVRRDANGAFIWGMGLQQIAQNYHRLNVAVTCTELYPGPALFIRGAESSYLDEPHAASIASYFPNAKLITIAQAGHLVHVDQAVRLFEALVSFLPAAK